MAIELQWEIEPCIPELETFLNEVANACMDIEGVANAGFTVRIVGGDTIHALNRELRGVDAPTDVLSFPSVSYPAGRTAGSCSKRVAREYDPELGCANLGDCVINLARARSQAEEYGHSLRREIGYLTAHSAFHLMGYDHITDEEKSVMRGMEKRAMDRLRLYREEEKRMEMIDYDRLFAEACEAMKNSYSPYSHFAVGACILTEDGSMFRGCNFENASFGATICAERCAAGAAIASGQHVFKAIAIAAEKEAAWPCGICRQVLSEFSAPDIPVIVGQAGKSWRMKTLGELLPESFGPGDLL